MLSDQSKRDFREDFTRTEIDRLIERFICLYTREPAEEWKHSTDEMMAVLQEAQEANRLRSEVERLRSNIDSANQRLAAAQSKLAHPDWHKPSIGTLDSHERRQLRRARKLAEQRMHMIEELLAENKKLSEALRRKEGGA